MANLSIMRGAWSLAVALVCVGCGARTDIDELEPAPPVGVVVDASSVDASIVDASTGVAEASLVDVPAFSHDASSPGEPDAACSTPSVEVTDCQPGNPTCCTFYIAWACHDVTYGLGGGCGSLDASSPTANYGCFTNGQWDFGVYITPVSSCACDDPSALGAFAEAHCGH